MQESTSYKPNLSRGILILGQPGMAKTTTALSIATPMAYISDCDNNLSGAVNFLKDSVPFLYDIPDLGATYDRRFEALSKHIAEASADPKINTIIVDSLTKVSDYVMDEILRQQNRKQMQLQDWGTFLTVMKRTITLLRSTQKLFIATAHIRPEKDEHCQDKSKMSLAHCSLMCGCVM